MYIPVFKCTIYYIHIQYYSRSNNTTTYIGNNSLFPEYIAIIYILQSSISSVVSIGICVNIVSSILQRRLSL